MAKPAIIKKIASPDKKSRNASKTHIRVKNTATARAPTSDINHITVGYLFMREKEAALESVNKLKGLIEKADLQSVKGHLIHYAEFEDMYPRIMDEPAPIVMLQVAAELCNHLENIDTIVSLLRDETKGPILKPTLSHNQH